MAHGYSSVSLHDVPAIVRSEPFRLPMMARAVLWMLFALGVMAFVIGVSGPNAKLAWVSFQVNFTYWLLVAAAATGFSAVFHISDGQWARPIRRIFESASEFLAWMIVPLVVLYFGREHLFVWAGHEKVPGKEMWLNANFVYARDLIGLVILVLLSRKVVFYSIARDIAAVSGGCIPANGLETSRWSEESYKRYVTATGQSGLGAIAHASARMTRLSPVVVIVYAFVLSLIAFDQIMAVDPHWYSTLFGAFYFMSGVYLAVAWVAILAAIARENHPLYRAKIEPRTLHDLGKLLFGFGIFWAYLFWSHYLTIWYGNIPEETSWVIVRLREEPWHSLSWFIFACCFICPFLIGLSRDVKKVPTLLFALGMMVVCGLWLQQYLLFAPTLFPGEIPLGWQDAAISLGFMGAFMLSSFSFLGKFPLVPFGDFYQAKELKEAA